MNLFGPQWKKINVLHITYYMRGVSRGEERGFQVGDHPNSGELKIKGMNLLGPNQRKRSSNAKPILRGVSIRRATKNQEC